MRTRDGGVDATALTGAFGGGGHARAAGATIELPLAEARTAVLELADAARRGAAGAVTAAQARRMARASTASSSSAKPTGPTSHDVVALVRRLTGVRRVGHGGTLDPFAMGVLPVFLGHATRMVEYHLADEKAYRASVVFGARSTTDDIDGEMTPGEAAPPVARGRRGRPGRPSAATSPGAAGPLGRARGRPPRLRAGPPGRDGPELAPRSVTIHALELSGWDTADPGRPMAVLEVRCSAGTYVRSLARDLGERLGCGAYLGALTRTASGPFRLEDAHPLDHVREELAAGRLEPLLRPMDAGLSSIAGAAHRGERP